MRLPKLGKPKIDERLPDRNEKIIKNQDLLRVLFIEDDPNDLELIVYNLEENGYKLEYDCVDQESDFLDYIEANTYDIIIADFQLPGWTGLDAYKMLKEIDNNTPLLLVTGAVGNDRAVECLKEGISDYILKDNLIKLPLEVSRILQERLLKTEHEQVDSQLIESLKQDITKCRVELELVNKEFETFTYLVSHDLRGPIRHISGFNNIVLSKYEDQLPDDAKNYLKKINDSVENMNDLIGGLLILSRAGYREMNVKPVDLIDTVNEVIQELEPDIEGRDIEWKIDKFHRVECDPDMIKIVITNLLSNAVKFTNKKEHAVIAVSPLPDGKHGFVVSDNGVGFDMKNHDRIFNVFQRLHKKEDFEGTGVGLAIVYKIMAKHNGCVWAEAQVDKGATFYVELP
ncbi:MAG: aerobic respiration control sensor protein ArcB [ANME-2 cluster archaeon HR1]|jgi:DNA-binding response OmpR family regulator|nr:MAG: aerobic respiration control sensor protein ArcB [ANME-2 cluster archaeon HR1]